MNWNLIRRFGKWIQEWPCAHGYHEWTLYRPGRSMWWRECKHCSLPDMSAQPARIECDVDHFNNVYLPSMQKHAR